LHTGARGQYVDVLGGTSKTAAPAAPGNLFNVLPKSASMPANIFVPNALGSCFYVFMILIAYGLTFFTYKAD